MKKLNIKRIVILLAVLLLGLLLGWLIFGQPKDNKKQSVDNEKVKETIWTCSMHPHIQKDEPGNCPICGMELIPLKSKQSGLDPDAVLMSPTAIQLAQIQTSTVGNGELQKTLRLNGKIQVDERLITTQSAHLSGRIESLAVSFTGEFVQKGQTLARIYSPALVSAQEELIEARRFKESDPSLYQASINKLKNWKLSDSQIKKLEQAEEPIEEFSLLANVSGYVMEKKVKEGAYVKQGDPIYEIADLSKVWVLFDVYESDLSWIQEGTEVKFSVPSLPGDTFVSQISYLDPTINPKTRVAHARASVKNQSLKLRPEMFVNALLQTELEHASDQIVVPKSSVMWTGKRSVVYVKKLSDKSVSFKMREVTLAEDLGNSYAIASGLSSGEEIATHGTFSIDAAAQLEGKPSMMNPDRGAAIEDNATAQSSKPKLEIKTTSKMKEALLPLFSSYFSMKRNLSKDEFEAAKVAANRMKKELNKIDMSAFEGNAHSVWMTLSAELDRGLSAAAKVESIDKIREDFIEISETMINLAADFQPLSDTVYVQHCPMANSNVGANWLSQEKEIFNPYFGTSMLKCGETVKQIH
jgi:Cu(I)/Ag(I) efflux system membrane fusion protein